MLEPHASPMQFVWTTAEKLPYVSSLRTCPLAASQKVQTVPRDTASNPHGYPGNLFLLTIGACRIYLLALRSRVNDR